MTTKLPPASPQLGLRGSSIIVFDLEMTAWEGSSARDWSLPGEHPEVVQIGAVRLRAVAGLPEEASLDLLIKPRFNPQLSDYFVALTGIENAIVAERGVSFAAGLAQFRDFCAGAGDILAFGRDHDFILRNCALEGLFCDIPGGRFRNVKPLLCAALDLTERAPTSGDLPGLLGFDPAGPAHQGLSDARAVAEALRVSARRGKLRLAA